MNNMCVILPGAEIRENATADHRARRRAVRVQEYILAVENHVFVSYCFTRFIICNNMLQYKHVRCPCTSRPKSAHRLPPAVVVSVRPLPSH